MNKTIGLNIFGNDTSGPDNTTFTDSDSRQDNCTSSDPATILYRHRQGKSMTDIFATFRYPDRSQAFVQADRIPSRINPYVGSECDPVKTDKGTTSVYHHPITYMNITTITSTKSMPDRSPLYRYFRTSRTTKLVFPLSLHKVRNYTSSINNVFFFSAQEKREHDNHTTHRPDIFPVLFS